MLEMAVADALHRSARPRTRQGKYYESNNAPRRQKTSLPWRQNLFEKEPGGGRPPCLGGAALAAGAALRRGVRGRARGADLRRSRAAGNGGSATFVGWPLELLSKSLQRAFWRRLETKTEAAPGCSALFFFERKSALSSSPRVNLPLEEHVALAAEQVGHVWRVSSAMSLSFGRKCAAGTTLTSMRSTTFGGPVGNLSGRLLGRRWPRLGGVGGVKVLVFLACVLCTVWTVCEMACRHLLLSALGKSEVPFRPRWSVVRMTMNPIGGVLMQQVRGAVVLVMSLAFPCWR